MPREQGDAQAVGDQQSHEDRGVSGSLGALAFAFGMWAAMLYAVVTAFDFHPAARTLPHIVGIPTLLVATLVLAREVAAWRRRKGDGPVEGTAAPDVRTELQAFGWFLGYTAGVLLVGFAIASPVFLVLFLKLYGKESWVTTILVTAVVTGTLVGLFAGVLNVGIYDGYLTVVLEG